MLKRDVVPAPPRTLMSRLRLLEDHIMKLEMDYPPWAALHFNQPNRGVCFSFIRYFTVVTYAKLVASTSTPYTDYSSITHYNRNQRANDRCSPTGDIIFLLYSFRRDATSKSEEQEQV